MGTEVVERAKRGDEAAFAELAMTFGDRLTAIAYRILRDPGRAEDAVQQALVTAWRRLPTLRDPDRFEAWLHRLLVHACFAEARETRRWTGSVRMIPVGERDPRDDFEQLARRDLLDRGFRRLSLEQRTVLVFHYYLSLTHPEIAERLDVPIGTVKSRIHAATAALRAAVDADSRVASRERPT